MEVSPLGGEHATHGTEIERVRHHRVQRICRNRHHAPSAHQGRGSGDGLGIGLFGVNFNQVGSHYYRGPIASATSMAIWYLPKGALNCTPWTIWRTRAVISRAMATPSARAFSALSTLPIRPMKCSGTGTRSSFTMHS